MGSEPALPAGSPVVRAPHLSAVGPSHLAICSLGRWSQLLHSLSCTAGAFCRRPDLGAACPGKTLSKCSRYLQAEGNMMLDCISTPLPPTLPATGEVNHWGIRTWRTFSYCRLWLKGETVVVWRYQAIALQRDKVIYEHCRLVWQQEMLALHFPGKAFNAEYIDAVEDCLEWLQSLHSWGFLEYNWWLIQTGKWWNRCPLYLHSRPMFCDSCCARRWGSSQKSQYQFCVLYTASWSWWLQFFA